MHHSSSSCSSCSARIRRLIVDEFVISITSHATRRHDLIAPSVYDTADSLYIKHECIDERRLEGDEEYP